MAKEPKQLDELFHDTLKDIYYAEKKILSALPKMAKAAQNEDLRAAFEKHHDETEGQIERLEQVFELIEEKPQGKKCAAIEGILEEGQEIIKEYKGSPALDAGLVSAAQAVEHYEIARYGTLRTWAEELGLDDADEASSGNARPGRGDRSGAHRTRRDGGQPGGAGRGGLNSRLQPIRSVPRGRTIRPRGTVISGSATANVIWSAQITSTGTVPMSDCLHCDINDLVEKQLERDDADLADLAARLTESLADLILLAPPADQSKLMADVLANLGQAYLEKTGAIESTPRH